MHFEIRYGMGGGFGGCGEWEESDALTLEDAEKEAGQLARECYESYEGMYGVRSEQNIMDEDGCGEEEAKEFYEDEIVSWIVYEAREVTTAHPIQSAQGERI